MTAKMEQSKPEPVAWRVRVTESDPWSLWSHPPNTDSVYRFVEPLYTCPSIPSPGGGGRSVYLAARYSRAPELRAYRDELALHGYTVTSRWLDGGHEITKEGSTEAHHAERARFAAEDRADLMAAATVVSFTEEPRKTTTRGGRHVEHGIALATGKRVIVVGHRENVFHCLPEVEFYPTWAEARIALAPLPAREVEPSK